MINISGETCVLYNKDDGNSFSFEVSTQFSFEECHIPSEGNLQHYQWQSKKTSLSWLGGEHENLFNNLLVKWYKYLTKVILEISVAFQCLFLQFLF